jgi:hypothetical protein
MVVLCKSCRIFTTNLTKFSLHFSDFYIIFNEFYKIQHLHQDLEETDLRTDPRISQAGPRDENLDCNWVPEAMAGGGSSIIARGRLGSAGKGWGSVQGVGRLRGRASEGARRHRLPVAAASSPPAKLRRGRAKTRHWRLQGILVKAARVAHGCGKEQEG